MNLRQRLLRDEFRGLVNEVAGAISVLYNNKDFKISEVITTLGDDKIYPQEYSTFYRAKDVGGFPYPLDQQTTFSVDWQTFTVRWGGADLFISSSKKETIESLIKDVQAQVESLEYQGFYTSLTQDEVTYE